MKLSDWTRQDEIDYKTAYRLFRSGLNRHRRALLQILEDPSFSIIVVKHRGRLARFGADYIDASPKANNRGLKVINEQELNIDLVQDMVYILRSFCARLYGQRASKNRAERALEAAQE